MGTGKPRGHLLGPILRVFPHVQQTWGHASPLGAGHGQLTHLPPFASHPRHGALPWAQQHPRVSHRMRLPHSSPLACLPASAGSSQPGGRPRRAAAEALAEPGLTFTSEKITPSKLRLFWGPHVQHESKRRLPWEPRGCVCCSHVSSLQGLLMSWLTSSQLNVSYAHLRIEPAAFASSLPFSQLLSSACLLAVPSPPPATSCGDQCWGMGSVRASPGDMWA